MSNDRCGEFRQGTNVETGIAWVGLVRKEVQYTVIDGDAVIEGCIILGPAEQIRADTESRRLGQPFGAGRADPKYLWPDGEVPYRIAAGLPRKERVLDAIAHWRKNTSITFVDLDKESNPGLYPNFVTFVQGAGCASSVGCQNVREQLVRLGAECTLGNVIHEIGHTVGLFHEQSRNDRDGHVTVLLDNVDASYRHNFTKMMNAGKDLGNYDYASIMHYPKDAFSRNGKDTIVPKDGQSIGQRVGLSAGDIAAVAELYKGIL
jgi:hypothetical protein